MSADLNSTPDTRQAPDERGVIALALRRPIGVIMSLVLTSVLGLIAYYRLPLQLLPDGFTPPFMWVRVPTLAASPEESEKLVAKPLEDALSTLAEIERLRTFVRTTNVGFAINLRPESDPDLSYTRIRARLRRTLPQLPEGAQRSIIWRHDPNDDPLFVFSVTYPRGHLDPARVIQEDLIRALERIDGVSRVEINGIKERAVRIEIKPRALKRAHITAEQLLRTLRDDHFTLTAGQLREGERALWVNASSRLDDLEAIRARPITSRFTLGELAEVKLAPDPRPTIHRVNAEPSCSVSVYKISTENTIEVARRVQARLDELFVSETLRHFKYREFFNQGSFIESSLNQIKSSALYGGVIALLCLWFFLRSLRLTLLITTAIPLCLLLTIALLYLRGQSLNVLSMMGIILSVGMVIDNAIVVLEQIVQRRAEGWSARHAALLGARGVALAVTLATSTTLVVFLPLMMVNDQPMLGFFITCIGEPVCYALSASLVIALIHLPTLSQWSQTATYIPQGSNRASSVPTRADERIYKRILDGVLKRRLGAALGTLLFLLSVGYPATHLNRVDQGGGAFRTLSVNVIGPLNGPQHELDELTRRIEQLLLPKLDELDIKTIVTARGWSPEHLRISLYLNAPAERKLNKEERERQIKALLPQRPGYRVQIRRGVGSGEQGVNIAVYGAYLSETKALAEQLRAQIKRLPEIDDALLDLPEGGLELQLKVNASWAQLRALQPAAVSAAVNVELQERLLGEMIVDQGPVDILLAPHTEGLTLDEVGRSVTRELSEASASSQRAPTDSLESSTRDSTGDSTRSPASRERSLDGIVTRQLEVGLGKIRRKQRRVQVNLQVLGDEGAVMSALERFLPQVPMPIGYGVDYGERFKSRRDNERGGALAVLVGIALVFCLMGLLFESLLTPLAILGTIPLAFVGSIWTLWLCGTSFEAMAIIGGVILVGVVVNNGIVLIDQIQALRRAGISRDEAVLSAAVTRLRPILMTAITTVGGLIPMAFMGGETVGIDYQPLGQVVIGGLTSSTLLTLIVVPLLYTLLDDLSGAPREARAWAHKALGVFKSRRPVK